MSKKINHAREAAEAFSDLNMLGAIQTLVQSSLMYDCEGVEQKITKLCNDRSQYLLRKYDHHMEKIDND